MCLWQAGAWTPSEDVSLSVSLSALWARRWPRRGPTPPWHLSPRLSCPLPLAPATLLACQAVPARLSRAPSPNPGCTRPWCPHQGAPGPTLKTSGAVFRRSHFHPPLSPRGAQPVALPPSFLRSVLAPPMKSSPAYLGRRCYESFTLPHQPRPLQPSLFKGDPLSVGSALQA